MSSQICKAPITVWEDLGLAGWELVAASGDPPAVLFMFKRQVLPGRHIAILPTNIPLSLIFYELFKVVNRRLALLVVCFSLVGTAVEGANVLNQFAPLILLGGGHYLSSFSTEQLQALAYLPLDLQSIGYDIQQVIYAGYLLAAGYLVLRSTFLLTSVVYITFARQLRTSTHAAGAPTLACGNSLVYPVEADIIRIDRRCTGSDQASGQAYLVRRRRRTPAQKGSDL
jgi:hypothetical protein